MQLTNTTASIAIFRQRVNADDSEDKYPFCLYAKGCKGAAFQIRSWVRNHTSVVNNMTFRSVHGQE